MLSLGESRTHGSEQRTARRRVPPPSDRGRRRLNYRHDFHAGNFADLVKHGLFLHLLGRMTAASTPLTVLDTHAGAGRYDLEGDEARRSGEAAAGVVRLMADPDAPVAFAPLKAAVLAANRGKGARFYPGSPALALAAIRPGDRYIGCELRPDDYARLDRVVGEADRRGQALRKDGYTVVAEPSANRRLVLIDPPFEAGDEYRRLLSTLAASLLRGWEDDVFAVWLPLKDLETFDGFLRGLEAMRPPRTLVAQVRMRPLDDPMRLNGCAMVVIGGPDVSGVARELCDWIVARLGEPGGEARVGWLGQD
ncbi:MAG: 23S rRNA (adenine(2030)-N(6))-methyltransferase RlmJ [Caulobacteraceae bacterium]